MLSLSRARALLSAASSLDQLASIARELGFPGPARRLDRATREAIGIPSAVAEVRISRGPGSTRALILDVTQSVPLKDALTRTASRLSSHAPQLLWLLLAIDADRAHVAVAAFSHERHPPRTRALLCERANVLDSDAETLCALSSARAQIDVLMHCRWTEVLGREALTRRFYLTLERVVESLAQSTTSSLGSADSRELSLLYVSRLLFLSFLETQGWLNGNHGFLANGFADCMADGGRYHRRVLLPLFFGTLNTPPRARSARARGFGDVPFLNGGLFSRSALERRARAVEFPDEAIGVLYGELLCRHRFTPREDSSEWSEAAVDPEMLGKAFESLMAPPERKSSGAFYTPQALVERVMREALAHALADKAVSSEEIESLLARREVPCAARATLLERLRCFRLLDPACGSGAFLVYALGELSWLAAACGDGRTAGDVTRSTLTTSIFGVDSNPMAVWLCELRLWLAMVMEQRDEGIRSITPLPNLDRQIRVGDTLTGGTFGAADRVPSRAVSRLRLRYTRSRGPRRKTLARLLDRTERALAIAALAGEMKALESARRELLLSARARDLFGGRQPPGADTRRALLDIRCALRELRQRNRNLLAGAALPFSFAAHFSEVADAGGFDLVAGNPPWIRLHRIPAPMRARLREEFRVFRGSAWTAGAEAARAGAGFGSQVDMAALFVERSLTLLRPGGIAALLLPAKLWSSLAGGGVRALLRNETAILTLEDLSGAPVAFDAAVYPSLLVARTSTPESGSLTRCAVHRRATKFAWHAQTARIPLDGTTGSPWILTPPDVRGAFDRLRAAGVPLAETRLARPLLGVKSGCNEAFVVTTDGGHDRATTLIRSGDRTGAMETALLRPAIKGEHIAPWRCARPGTQLIWTHGCDGRALRSLPQHARQWLDHYRARLEARTDGRSSERWWSLFRTDGAACDLPRVVWADVGKRPRAAVLAQGDEAVPLNTCYVVRCRDEREALTFAAILNSDLAAAWLNLVAEPARGGYHRYLGWTMALLPLPRDWSAACATLPAVARSMMDGGGDSRELLEVVLGAYCVRFADVEPLLAWTG
ncbi:MAG: DNA methyltransferase [Gemmatimonadaceae bacterium]